jgi:hypothetical protein
MITTINTAITIITNYSFVIHVIYHKTLYFAYLHTSFPPFRESTCPFKDYRNALYRTFASMEVQLPA